MNKSYLTWLNSKTKYIPFFLRILNFILILFVFHIISFHFYFLSVPLVRLTTIVLLLTIFMINIKKPLTSVYTKSFLRTYTLIGVGLSLVIFSLFILLISTNPIIWVASIPVYLIGLRFLQNNHERSSLDLTIITAASLFYTLFYLMVQTVPFLWFFFQQSSLQLSNGIGTIIGQSSRIGPTVSGLWVVLTTLIMLFTLIVLDLRENRIRTRKIFLSILLTTCIWFFYILLIEYFLTDAQQYIDILLVLFILINVVPLLYYLKDINLHMWGDIQLKQSSKTFFIKLKTFAGIVLLCIALVSLTISLPPVDNQQNKKILFSAENMLGTWDVPEYGKYGRDAAGMFGLLPIYLSSFGYQTYLHVTNTTRFVGSLKPVLENVTRTMNLTDYAQVIESPAITSEMLSEIDVFVVINRNTTFSALEHKTIWEFVENGGSLLVLGDHTDVGGIQDPLNSLLQPVGIQYGFDSALPLDSRLQWSSSIHLFYHPLTSTITTVDELQISVGASLSISETSFPVIVGRYAFADQGERDNKEMAYLGDYQYSPGEQLGDVVLVAGHLYGEGKVLVFGDTSTFQNTAVPMSYTFIYRVFDWLADGQGNQNTLLMNIGHLVLFLVAFILLIPSALKILRLSWFVALVCVVVLVSTSVAPLMLRSFSAHGNIVSIDASHVEYFTVAGFTDESLSGFMINLQRNGFLPIITKSFSEELILKSNLLIFNQPTKRFSDSEISLLQTYMDEGGIIFVSSNHALQEAIEPLFSVFSITILNVPLGPVPEPYVESINEYEYEPRVVDAWPIDYPQALGSSYYNFTWNSVGYPLMVFFPHGAGGMLVIGDNQYLFDKNIESIYDYWPGNIIFLKNLLDEFHIQRGAI